MRRRAGGKIYHVEGDGDKEVMWVDSSELRDMGKYLTQPENAPLGNGSGKAASTLGPPDVGPKR